MATVVIPAHNEGRVIRRLLEQLINGADPGEMDIIVVANGCEDDTAEVAASFGQAVRILTLPVACKHAALTAGDRAAAGFPRIYVDADVELRVHDVRALAAALCQPGVLAAAPRRELVMTGRPAMLPRVGYFLSVAVFARLRASRARARGDYLTWLRDESSRTASTTAAAQSATRSAAPPSGARPAVPVAAMPVGWRARLRESSAISPVLIRDAAEQIQHPAPGGGIKL